jgi:hypothetical protein
MKEDKKVDEALKNALQEIEAGDEESSGIMREMLVDAFKTKVKMILLLIWGYSVAFIALAAFLIYRSVTAVELREVILYSAASLASIGGIITLKLIYISMVNRSTLEREIKRLELRVIELQNSLLEK